MTRKEQFLNVWVKKLPDGEQKAFVRQLDGLLQPVADVRAKPKLPMLQKLLHWRVRLKYNKIVRELASVRAMLEVYAIHSDARMVKKIAHLKGRKATLETHAQQIRDRVQGMSVNAFAIPQGYGERHVNR